MENGLKKSKNVTKIIDIKVLVTRVVIIMTGLL